MDEPQETIRRSQMDDDPADVRARHRKGVRGKDWLRSSARRSGSTSLNAASGPDFRPDAEAKTE